MKKSFEYSFDDLSSESIMEFDYNEFLEEKFSIKTSNGLVSFEGNREAFLFLAKVFLKMGLCDYKNNFHVHFSKDFNADEQDILKLSYLN